VLSAQNIKDTQKSLKALGILATNAYSPSFVGGAWLLPKNFAVVALNFTLRSLSTRYRTGLGQDLRFSCLGFLAVMPNNSFKPRPLRGLARVSLAGCGPA